MTTFAMLIPAHEEPTPYTEQVVNICKDCEMPVVVESKEKIHDYPDDGTFVIALPDGSITIVPDKPEAENTLEVLQGLADAIVTFGSANRKPKCKNGEERNWYEFTDKADFLEKRANGDFEGIDEVQLDAIEREVARNCEVNASCPGSLGGCRS